MKIEIVAVDRVEVDLTDDDGTYQSFAVSVFPSGAPSELKCGDLRLTWTQISAFVAAAKAAQALVRNGRK